jgi:hypothetical protein
MPEGEIAGALDPAEAVGGEEAMGRIGRLHCLEVDLKVKLFARGRPPLETKLHVSVDTSHALDNSGGSGNEYVSALLTNSDVALFRAVSKRLRTAKRLWEVKVRGRSATLALAKTRYGRGLYSGLLLSGKVTEVHADTNADGLLDYQLLDSSDPPSPRSKVASITT